MAKRRDHLLRTMATRRGRLSGEGATEALARFLGSLAEPTRLRILSLLSRGELCVCHIHGGLGLSQPTVSRHLAQLRRAGLVEARRQGVWVYYAISPLLSGGRRALLEAVVEQAREPRRAAAGAGRTPGAQPRTPRAEPRTPGR